MAKINFCCVFELTVILLKSTGQPRSFVAVEKFRKSHFRKRTQWHSLWGLFYRSCNALQKKKLQFHLKRSSFLGRWKWRVDCETREVATGKRDRTDHCHAGHPSSTASHTALATTEREKGGIGVGDSLRWFFSPTPPNAPTIPSPSHTNGKTLFRPHFENFSFLSIWPF